MPINPFLDLTQIESFPRVFDVNRFWHDMTGTNDDPPTLSFIEPSQADIEAIQRDLAPHAEACARK
jgi:hypothetical protein